MSSRRRFVTLMPWAPLAGAALLAGCSDKAAPRAGGAAAPSPAPSPAPAPPAAPRTVAPPTMPAVTGLVSPSDVQARQLGYVPLTRQADATKYQQHALTQTCSSCAIYTGRPGAPQGPCPVMGGRLVSAQGWCSAWVKKA